MAWTDLKTNYTDASWSGDKRYTLTDHSTYYTIEDITTYTNLENSFFGASDANAINSALNSIAPIVLADNAGAHNAIYRGKYLGTRFTSAQQSAVDNGTFEDLYIGDYWTIDGVNYRIAAFDYYLHTGDSAVTRHHVTLVPDTCLGQASMNSSNTTAGGFKGSAMWNSALSSVDSIIIAAFGGTRILAHRQYYTTEVTSGVPTAGEWTDSAVTIMTEANVYGTTLYAPHSNGTTIPDNRTVDFCQLPLFAFNKSLIAAPRQNWWLRDILSGTSFAMVSAGGLAAWGGASGSRYIRPIFSIVG